MTFEYIVRAWEAYKKNAMGFILAQLIVLIISGICLFISLAIIASIGISTLRELSSNLVAYEMVSFFPAFASILISLIFFILAGLSFVYLNIGIYGMAFETTRGKTMVKTMFKIAMKKGITGILAAIMIGIIFFIITTFLSIGYGLGLPLIGIATGSVLLALIMVFFSLTFPAIVADNLGAFKAVERSVNAVKKNYFDVFILLFTYAIIFILLAFFIPIIGILICYFVLIPMFYISLILFYKRKK
jgi:uncharacterized membrane protein